MKYLLIDCNEALIKIKMVSVVRTCHLHSRVELLCCLHKHTRHTQYMRRFLRPGGTVILFPPLSLPQSLLLSLVLARVCVFGRVRRISRMTPNGCSGGWHSLSNSVSVSLSPPPCPVLISEILISLTGLPRRWSANWFTTWSSCCELRCYYFTRDLWGVWNHYSRTYCCCWCCSCFSFTWRKRRNWWKRFGKS